VRWNIGAPFCPEKSDKATAALKSDSRDVVPANCSAPHGSSNGLRPEQFLLIDQETGERRPGRAHVPKRLGHGPH